MVKSSQCLIEPADICVEAPVVTALSFTVKGWRVFIVPQKPLKCIDCVKTADLITYRLSSVKAYGEGLFEMIFSGSDGSTLKLFQTAEDLLDAMGLVVNAIPVCDTVA